jgi:hypothetical protein
MTSKNGKQPQFFGKIEDDLSFLKMEDDLILILMEDDLQQNSILTNSTAQHRQPDQHINQKYIGTNEEINLNWL